MGVVGRKYCNGELEPHVLDGWTLKFCRYVEHLHKRYGDSLHERLKKGFTSSGFRNASGGSGCGVWVAYFMTQSP